MRSNLFGFIAWALVAAAITVSVVNTAEAAESGDEVWISTVTIFFNGLHDKNISNQYIYVYPDKESCVGAAFNNGDVKTQINYENLWRGLDTKSEDPVEYRCFVRKVK